MSTSKYLNGNGLSEVWTNTKNYIASQLLGKSDVGHTHTMSDITDLEVWNYDSNSNSIIVSGSIVPSTDNSVDLGASSKNIKMIYTKGITINGTQFLPSDYIPRSGGSIITGTEFCRVSNAVEVNLSGGSTLSNGGVVKLLGDNHPNVAKQGTVILVAQKSGTGCTMILYPNGTWTWDGTACQITSDQRLKQQIAKIDDKLLDAWEDVELSQFKYNDAVDEKGKDKARLHTGYVVQQIDSACKSHGVDVSKYGLYCHEVYQEETREVEHEDGTKVKERKVIREASEHYSLRYTEALIVECAYLRKCIKELRTEIEELKK